MAARLFLFYVAICVANTEHSCFVADWVLVHGASTTALACVLPPVGVFSFIRLSFWYIGVG